MTQDASHASKTGSEFRSSDVQLARAQIDAARARQQKLVASGKLAAPPIEFPPIQSLPGYTIVRELRDRAPRRQGAR